MKKKWKNENIRGGGGYMCPKSVCDNNTAEFLA